jgi:phosphoglycolate phosphatase
LRLLLFDIDGTLLITAGAGRLAMERAFESLYGFPDALHGIGMMGRTDTSIFKEVLNFHGLCWSNDAEADFKTRYFKELRDAFHSPSIEKKLLPGISDLLSALRNRNGFVTGLVTGNWRESGYFKLDYFGITEHFPDGAFSDDSEFRDWLVGLAVSRFETRLSVRFSKRDVVVIGDTPLDVAAAQSFGARSVAVATGFHPIDTLAASGADAVFPDFSDTNAVIRALAD